MTILVAFWFYQRSQFEKHYTGNYTEVEKITDVLKYVKKGDLVVFDPVQTLITFVLKDEKGGSINFGNKAYFEAIDKYIMDSSVDMNLPKVFDKISKMSTAPVKEVSVRQQLRNYIYDSISEVGAEKILHKVKKLFSYENAVLVDKSVISVFNKLKQKNIPAMIFAGDWEYKDKFESCLDRLGIKIDTKNLPTKTIIEQPLETEDKGFAFSNGVLYLIKNTNPDKVKVIVDKANILARFLKKIKYPVKKLLLVFYSQKLYLENIKTFVPGVSLLRIFCREIDKYWTLSHTLGENEISLLNSKLEKGWHYIEVDADKAAKYILDKLSGGR
jgi:hypothetical protein